MQSGVSSLSRRCRSQTDRTDGLPDRGAGDRVAEAEPFYRRAGHHGWRAGVKRQLRDAGGTRPGPRAACDRALQFDGDPRGRHGVVGRFLSPPPRRADLSLPCYTADNVDRQRGNGVFDKSILALRLLNQAGYGRGELPLDLVYNPVTPMLAPDQAELEGRYRDALGEN